MDTYLYTPPAIPPEPARPPASADGAGSTLRPRRGRGYRGSMSFVTERLLLLVPVLALALPACKPIVVGCQEPIEGGPAVPDASFEEAASLWGLAPHSTIDDQQGVCGGPHSLRVRLDHGLGPAEVTRSAPITGTVPGQTYEVAFHYRFDHCKAASLSVHIGNYEHQLHFEGAGGEWGETSIDVTFGTEPTVIDIRPLREGAESDYATADHDNNLMWVDDFTIIPL
jgi:hypothetical protein